MASSLVSCGWLRQQLINGLKNIRVVDATWEMDSGSEGGRKRFNEERIQEAVFLDLDQLSDQNSQYDHMLPSAQQFGDHIGRLGISPSNHVVVYDTNVKFGLFSSPRIWWMFRVFGHREVSVLNGGLGYWKQCQYPVDTGAPHTPQTQSYAAQYNPELVRTTAQVTQCLASGSVQVVDARSQGRFEGTAPEPRPSFPSGHMIGAKNVPYMNLIDPQTKLLKDNEGLGQAFQLAGVDLSNPMVSTCGSGITAAVVTLAAHLLHSEVPLYDGSWVEWVQAAPASSRTKPVQ